MTDSRPSGVDAEGVLRVFQTREQTRAFYNKIAKVYDVLAERSEAPMRDLGLQSLAPRPGETILEVGFGTGHCLVELARRVGSEGRVLGIDLAENMVSQARARIRESRLDDRIRLLCGDAARLPFESDSVDGIFSSFMLELFDTPEIPLVLEEWRRVLRPGGRLAVVSISMEGPQGAVSHAFRWTHQHFPNLVDCRPIFVSRSLASARFAVEVKEIRQMWVPVEIVLGIKGNAAEPSGSSDA